MLPNVPPKLFSLSAVVVGYILIDDMTANEQNAVGNWLMLVAQVISTNAFYKQVMQERGITPVGSTESGKPNPNANYSNRNNTTKNGNSNEEQDTLVMLEKMVKAMQIEIEEIKNNIKKI